MSARLAVRKCVQSDTDKKQKKRLDEESLDEEKCFMLEGMVWTLGFVTLGFVLKVSKLPWICRGESLK